MENGFSSSARSTVGRIVEAVAAHADADPLELPPLYDAIDTDAVGALFQEGSEGRVQFRYAGRAVTVHSEGTVEVGVADDLEAEPLGPPADD